MNYVYGKKQISTIEFIKSDCQRYCGKNTWKEVIFLYIKNWTFRWQVAFRLCGGRGLAKIFGTLLWGLNRSKKLIQISTKTRIGLGLFIGHGGPIVINPTAVIGNNCNLSQCVTIGTNHGKAAVIGNNVYIGPNVCIVEDVEIGDNATIGAGSVVTKSIPGNATAAGNYAKVLNYDNPGRYITNTYINFGA